VGVYVRKYDLQRLGLTQRSITLGNVATRDFLERQKTATAAAVIPPHTVRRTHAALAQLPHHLVRLHRRAPKP
jgi:hypothetical protein